ncbi:MAG: hypothetical protein ACK5LV_09590 [Lachnospirales bacterium]
MKKNRENGIIKVFTLCLIIFTLTSCKSDGDVSSISDDIEASEEISEVVTDDSGKSDEDKTEENTEENTKDTENTDNEDDKNAEIKTEEETEEENAENNGEEVEKETKGVATSTLEQTEEKEPNTAPKEEVKEEVVEEVVEEVKEEPAEVVEEVQEEPAEVVEEVKEEPVEVVEEVQEVANTGSFSESDLAISGSGGSIRLGDSDNKIDSVFGTNYTKSDVTSCVNDGTDSVYIFSGMEVMTYEPTPGQGSKTIFEVTVFGSSYKTPKGIGVGSSKADVISTYGTNYQQVGKCIEYSAGGQTLSFLISGGTVSNISYLMF